MTPHNPAPHELSALGRAVADALPAVAPDRLARQRARVASIPLATPARRAPAVAALGLGLAAAAVLVARFTAREPAAPPPLRARVDAAPLAVGQWVAAANVPVTLRFSDGSELRLAPGAHARVVSLDATGARVLLERGRAEATVHHGPRARWTFAAGPYAVQVTGTRFALAWEPERGRFDLAMREGSVTLRGPRCAEGMGLRGRDEVHADVAADTLTVGPAQRDVALGPVPQLPIPAQPVPQLPIPVEPPHARPRRTAPSLGAHAPVAPSPTPPEAQPPVAATPTPADAASLLDEAERALRARDHHRARALLIGLRSRFPGTPEAARAAFSLGVASQALGAPATAAGWFERYLRDAAGGSLANEARGRRVEALHAAGDVTAAREAAEDYLLHDPNGAFAPLARGILRP